jgi:hypothetical protein
MAASSSVLGCLKTGAFTDRFVFRTSPLVDNFRRGRDVACLLFMSTRINSRVARPADAVILRSRLGRRFLFSRRALFWAAWRFTGIAVFPFLNIDQGDHRAIDFVIGGTIRPHAQGVRAAFLIGHFALPDAQCFDHVTQNILQIGQIDIRSELGDAPSDICGPNVESIARS